MEIKGLLFKAADKIMAFLNTHRKPRIYVLNSQFNYVPYNVIYITLDIVFRNECTVSRNLYDISVILRNKKDRTVFTEELQDILHYGETQCTTIKLSPKDKYRTKMQCAFSLDKGLLNATELLIGYKLFRGKINQTKVYKFSNYLGSKVQFL